MSCAKVNVLMRVPPLSYLFRVCLFRFCRFKKIAFGALALSSVFIANSASYADDLPSPSYFAGRWGTVAYNDDGDLGRMAQVARGYCGALAYKIERKSDDTFSMYVAEALKDVRVMERDGSLFIVPIETDQGVFKGARELKVRDKNTFTLRYLETHNHHRYGLNVFVRCGGR